MILTSIFELFSLASLIPFISVLISPEKVLEIRNEINGIDHIESYLVHNYLGEVNEDLNLIQDAENHYLTALKIKEKHFGKDHKDNIILLYKH